MSNARDARAKAIIPQGGDTVFLRGETKRMAMYLERTYTKDRVKYGTCSWKVYEMFDDELIEQEKQQEFLLSELTLFIEPPRNG